MSDRTADLPYELAHIAKPSLIYFDDDNILSVMSIPLFISRQSDVHNEPKIYLNLYCYNLL